MTVKKLLFFIVTIFNLVLAACAAAQPNATAAPDVPLPVETLTPVSTTIPTDLPALATVVDQSVGGAVIYDDAKNIVSINLDTGETKVLISRDELQLILGQNKSEASYTYGDEKPVEINLSPDFKKAHISICAALDSRFRCGFEDYIYDLEGKTAVKLQSPPVTYGVYWKWAPDGSKLAGAAWTYTGAAYELTSFYSINSDGTNLIFLGDITNGHWQIVWHPGSNVVLPLTFITNFRSVFADGSLERDIPIAGLEWNDKMECLAFSPDASQAAFVIRREIPKNHDWLYIVRSDFVELSLVTEFDIDSRYGCEIAWSPDNSSIHLEYEYARREETGQIAQNEDLSPLDKVVNIETGDLATPQANSRVCGWTPNGDLVYEKKDFAGEEAGIEVFNLADNEPVQLPENIQAIIRHCPVQWLEKELDLNIPEGIAVPDACHPGVVIPDEIETRPLNLLFDILEVSTLVDGNVLSVVMTLDTVSTDLSAYTTPGVTDFLNGWDVFVDIDNNVLTGDQLGIDYRFSVVIRPENNGAPPSLGSAVLKYDPAGKSFVRAGALQFSLDPEAKTLTLNGETPGISQDTRLVFLSRMADTATGSVIGDRICD